MFAPSTAMPRMQVFPALSDLRLAFRQTQVQRPASTLPVERQSGHGACVAALGVKQPPSDRLATADADLPSLS